MTPIDKQGSLFHKAVLLCRYTRGLLSDITAMDFYRRADGLCR